MRLCPKCGTTYSDDAYACGLDGRLLVPATPDAAWVPAATSGLKYDPVPMYSPEPDLALGEESTLLPNGKPQAEARDVLAERGQGGFTALEVELVEGKGTAKLDQRFRPIAQIAQGGMGRVILAEERNSGRCVALKLMTDNDPSLVQQFIREGIITARLEHPNVIPVYELGFLTAGQLYYTMRYVESMPLSVLMPRLDLRGRVRILRDAARAVAFAHGQGLWHRDLKPDNILVGRFGDVYVIDWGLVTVQHGREYRLDLPRIVVESANYEFQVDRFLRETGDALTAMSGLVAGTLPFMAPEQVRGDGWLMGAPSDVWAFGVMLFRAMTGQHPVRGVSWSASTDDVVKSILEHEIRDVRELEPDAPAELASLCQRMLVADSRSRISLEVFIAEAGTFLERPVSTT
jgi:serine/threonine protein kinase